MTANTLLKQILLFSLTTYLFVGCFKDETLTTKSVETLKQPKAIASTEILPIQSTSTQPPQSSSSNEADYGEYKEEIEAILSAAPVGSEIYLEQRDDGDWYLKIEKVFTAKKTENKQEESLYGETILI